MPYRPRELFDSAVPYYARYRSGYPAGRMDELAASAGLDGRRRALDIGCGTGQFTLPLARHARSVLAIDPLAGMLAAGQDAARAAGLVNIEWRQGDSGDLDRLAVPGVWLAAFAASFHWTDRGRVLRALDALVDPAGCVVITNDVLAERDQPDWMRAIDRIRSRYLGTARRAGSGHYVDLTVRHAEVLTDSPFPEVERRVWRWTRQLTAEQVTGLQFSYSFSTPALLGDRSADFAAEVRDAVFARHPSGVVPEPFEVEVLIARRA